MLNCQILASFYKKIRKGVCVAWFINQALNCFYSIIFFINHLIEA